MRNSISNVAGEVYEGSISKALPSLFFTVKLILCDSVELALLYQLAIVCAVSYSVTLEKSAAIFGF